MQKSLSTQTAVSQESLEHPHPYGQSTGSEIIVPVLETSHRPIDYRLRRPRFPKDIAARLSDGLVPAVLLLVLTMMMDMLIYPIQAVANREGLLIYLILVLAMGVFALEKSTHPRGTEIGRAISGMVAGQFFWHSLWIIQLLGGIDLNPEGTILILVLITLLGLTLWRPVLPLGVKFFLISFMASWINRFFVNHSITQSAGIDFYNGLFYATGFLALAGVVFGIAYLIFRAEFKVQRLWAALGIWQSALVTLIVALKMFL
jgi:hypothetical protein